jgi:hypothetical protein
MEKMFAYLVVGLAFVYLIKKIAVSRENGCGKCKDSTLWRKKTGRPE